MAVGPVMGQRLHLVHMDTGCLLKAESFADSSPSLFWGSVSPILTA